MSTSNPPNQTIYVHQLPEKIQKQELRTCLYELFSAYGRVLDVVALKTIKMRGQAFIVFRDIASATAAMRGLNNFVFFDQPMKIEYAKTKSKALATSEGAFDLGAAPAAVRPVPKPAANKAAAEKQVENVVAMDTTEDLSTVAGTEEESETNSVLFLQNLPEEVTEESLTLLFQQYTGFKEIRLIPGKSELAFVEYETSEQAAIAKSVLNGFKISSTRTMRVSFAKR